VSLRDEPRGAQPPRADDALRRRLGRAAIRVSVTIAVLWALLRAVDLERVHFSRIQAPWLVLGLLSTLPQMLGVVLRWRFTAARLGLHIPFGEAFREYYVSSLANQLLPSGIAGDALRAARHGVRLGAEHAGLSWRAVLIERVAGQLVMMLCALLSAPLWLEGRWFLPVGGALVLVVAVALGAIRLASERGWLPGFARLVLGDAVKALFEPRALLAQLGTSLLTIVSCIAMFGCCARALSAPLGLPDLVRIAPLVLAAMTLPVSFAGWGIRELASSALYSAGGLDPAVGAATSILYGALSLVGATPGLAVIVWPKRA
jgi:uncharacterized membrane protein YbhN (UPF0104 family)